MLENCQSDRFIIGFPASVLTSSFTLIRDCLSKICFRYFKFFNETLKWSFNTMNKCQALYTQSVKPELNPMPTPFAVVASLPQIPDNSQLTTWLILIR